MSKIRHRVFWVLLALAILAIPSAEAALVQELNLAEVCDRADLVFRGTVLDVTEGTIQAGGGELPTVTYRFKVDEAFKGDFIVKGDESYAEITMLGRMKPEPAGEYQKFSALPELPQFRVGSDYVLMTTAPSAIGLSAPVGLAQGAYGISSIDKTEIADNGVNPALNYADLADQIRATLGQ